MHVLVMGGTRFMGRETVNALLKRDHQVTVFNRGSRTVDWEGAVREVAGDRDHAAALRPLNDLAPDAVIDFSAYTGAQTELLLDALPGVERWVHCSTGAVYQPQPTLPWPETTPYGPWILWGTYGAEKLRCEQVLRVRRPAAARTTMLRLPYVLGPRNYADREEFVLNRVLDGAAIVLPGDGCAVQQFVHIRQVAEAMVNTVERSPQGCHAYNVATPELASIEGFVKICSEVSGANARVHRLGNAVAEVEPFNAVDPVFPFPNQNYILDCALAARDGIAPAPMSLREMIDDALGALTADPGRRAWKRYPAEAAAMAAIGVS